MSETESMTAAVLTGFGGPDVLQVRNDVPVPKPERKEILVQVKAASVNNTDIWTREGAYGLPGQPDAKAGWRGSIDFPRIQGADVVGTVHEIGEEVDESRLGRRVLLDPSIYETSSDDANPIGLLGSEMDGGFAQYVVVSDTQAHDVTDSPLSDSQLSCIPTSYGTAMGMLERAGIKEGETILVTGASGGVGYALVQLASVRGVRVIGLTTSEKSDLVVRAGAYATIDRNSPDLLKELKDTVPEGLSAVADVVGGKTLETVLPVLQEGGRWVIAGAVGGATINFDLRRLYLNNKTLIGSSMHTPSHFRKLVDVVNSGRIQPRVAETFSLSDIQEAQEMFKNSRHVGKIVLLPPQE